MPHAGLITYIADVLVTICVLPWQLEIKHEVGWSPKGNFELGIVKTIQ